MKKNILFFVVLFVFCHPNNAQNDTMYIMKNGVAVGKYNVNSQVDSVIFYKPQPPNSGTFTDSRDGNVYKWVKIGNQIWMAENLRYLPSVVAPTTGSTTTPCYYVYDYYGTDVNVAKATANYKIYGVLYNWPAIMGSSVSSSTNPSGVRGIAPEGWHIPSDAEWTQLSNYLGGVSVAGGKLKETGTKHWNSPNTGAKNETGLSALPGGLCISYLIFSNIGGAGYWWSATEGATNKAWGWPMTHDTSNLSRLNYSKEYGFSVLCIKD